MTEFGTVEEEIIYLRERVRQMGIEMGRMERDLAMLIRDYDKRQPRPTLC